MHIIAVVCLQNSDYRYAEIACAHEKEQCFNFSVLVSVLQKRKTFVVAVITRF